MDAIMTENNSIKDDFVIDHYRKAIEKQRIFGGRIDYNSLASTSASESELSSFFNFLPTVPTNIDDTNLDHQFVYDLVIKHALIIKNFTVPDLVKRSKLAQPVIAECVDVLRKDKLIEIRSTNQSFSIINSEYRITEAGINRAAHLLEENRYIGPAPVALNDYSLSVELQTGRSIEIDKNRLKQAFADIVMSDDKLNTLGAAINSGKPIFIYGPSGNGKSTIASALGDVIPGEIYIPYSIMAGGQIIVLYDEINHTAVEVGLDAEKHDERWVKIKRPVIFAGGELTLKSLDLEFNETTKYYEAPLQVKANNGIFVVDDFGRQLIDPQILLNRWIVPLERRADFLTLSTGLKFEIPFDQMVIFATNISPKELADEAFLRRLRYKILIDSPGLKEFQKIFSSICEFHKIEYSKEAFNRLIMHYKQSKTRLNACHPRDLIDHIIDDAHFSNASPVITPEAIDMAWKNYFFDHKVD